MKKSEIMNLVEGVARKQEAFLSSSQVKAIVEALEKVGVIAPTYFIKESSGLFTIKYGWEPEDVG